MHRATLVAARSVDVVYGYQSPSATVEFRRAFAAIDDQLERKLAMIAAYSSQAARAYLDPELFRATARYWAASAVRDSASRSRCSGSDPVRTAWPTASSSRR